MLSRRSVRIKVMQLIYSLDRDESLKPKDIIKSYSSNIELSFELFLFSVYVIYNITQVSTNDMAKRKSKHLPTEIDKSFTDKLVKNPLMQDIAENTVLAKKWEALEFESKINKDYISKIYDAFAKTESYQEFISKETTDADVLELLLELFRFCRQNEYYNEMLEDNFYNWVDDKSLVVGTVKKYLKLLPTDSKNSFKEFLPEDETVKEFGLNLLKKTVSSKEQLMQHIIPVLENWDHERLALVDTILLQMALCELKDFPTIPTKVTMNEYVELAKHYSTVKSKEFINGILDKLSTELIKSGDIVKEGRGLEE